MIRALAVLFLLLVGCKSLEEQGCGDIAERQRWVPDMTTMVYFGNNLWAPITYPGYWTTERYCRKWGAPDASARSERNPWHTL